MGCVKDWTGNSNSARTLLGSTGNADNVREDNDFYATHPLATELLHIDNPEDTLGTYPKFF